MFEKTSRLAEQIATSVSRRGFLGSLGRCAATAALGVAGVLSGGRTALAHRHDHWCCVYNSPQPLMLICVTGTSCPTTCCGYSLFTSYGPYKSCTACEQYGPVTSYAGCPC
jgi:hypothetical protein